MNISRFKGVIAVILFAFWLSGCTAPVKNVHTSDFSFMDRNVTQDEVGKAIKYAGTKLGWEVKVDKPGVITATLHLRTHTAKTRINYTANGYDITYLDSTNLNYDGQKIHKNYNRWVRNLDMEIRTRLVSLE